MEFIFLIILLLFSVAFHLLLKMKIEQSIFFTVCLFFIIMFISGLAANLTVGYFVIISTSVISAGYIIYKAIKKQIRIFEIITPGTVVFIAAFIIYYISTRGALLHMWDEATHWGLSAKKMYYSGELWTSGLQTLAAPLFNQIMIKLTGYSESALYLSQWTIYLSCIILPLSEISWKKSYLAVIYSTAAIFAVSSVIPYGNLTLYADGLLSFFFAALVLAWYLEENRDYRRYIWAGAGLFMLVQLKSGSGMSLAVMFIAFALFSDAVLNPSGFPAKKVYVKNLKTFLLLAASMAVSIILLSAFGKSSTGKSSSGIRIHGQLGSSAMFIIFAVIMALAIILFALYTINLFSKKSVAPVGLVKRLLVIFASLTVVAGLGVLFYSTLLRPDFDVTTTVLNFLSAFIKIHINSMPAAYFIASIVALFIINSALAPKEEKSSYIGFYSAVLIFSGLYIVGVLYAYLSSFSLSEAVNTASFDRYVGTAIMFAVMFCFMPLLRQSGEAFKKRLPHFLLLTVCAVLLCLSFVPAFRVCEITSSEAGKFRKTEIKGANQVKAHVTDDQKVFIVIQGDKGFVFNWMRYEFAPITTNGGYWSFGENGGWNFAWSEDKMKQFLHDAHYDYLYLFDSNEYFAQHFATLFGQAPPESRTLYKFDYENDPVLIPVK